MIMLSSKARIIRSIKVSMRIDTTLLVTLVILKFKKHIQK